MRASWTITHREEGRTLSIGILLRVTADMPSSGTLLENPAGNF